jgi:hypothetical protein
MLPLTAAASAHCGRCWREHDASSQPCAPHIQVSPGGLSGPCHRHIGVDGGDPGRRRACMCVVSSRHARLPPHPHHRIPTHHPHPPPHITSLDAVRRRGQLKARTCCMIPMRSAVSSFPWRRRLRVRGRRGCWWGGPCMPCRRPASSRCALPVSLPNSSSLPAARSRPWHLPHPPRAHIHT